MFNPRIRTIKSQENRGVPRPVEPGSSGTRSNRTSVVRKSGKHFNAARALKMSIRTQRNASAPRTRTKIESGSRRTTICHQASRERDKRSKSGKFFSSVSPGRSNRRASMAVVGGIEDMGKSGRGYKLKRLNRTVSRLNIFVDEEGEESDTPSDESNSSRSYDNLNEARENVERVEGGGHGNSHGNRRRDGEHASLAQGELEEAQIRSLAAQLEEQKVKFSFLEAQKQDLEAVNGEIRSMLTASQRRVEEKEKALASACAGKREMEIRMNKMEKSVTELRKSEMDIEQMEKQQNSLRISHENSLQQNDKQKIIIRQLSTEKEQLLRKINALKQEFENVQSDALGEVNEKEALMRVIDELRKKEEESEGENQRVKNLEIELEDLKERNVELSREVQKFQTEKKKAKSSSEDDGSKDDLKRKNEELVERLKRKIAEKAEFGAEIESLKGQVDDLRKKNAESHAEMNREREEMNEMMEELLEERKKKDQESEKIADLKVSMLEKEASKMESVISESNGEVEKMRHKNVELEKTVANLRNELRQNASVNKVKIAEKMRALKSFERNNELLKEMHVKTKLDCVKMQKAKNELVEKNRVLKSKIEHMKKRVKETTQTLFEVQEELKSAYESSIDSEKVKELESQLGEFQKLNKELVGKVKRREERYRRLKEKAKLLERKSKQKGQQIGEMKQELLQVNERCQRMIEEREDYRKNIKKNFSDKITKLRKVVEMAKKKREMEFHRGDSAVSEESGSVLSPAASPPNSDYGREKVQNDVEKMKSKFLEFEEKQRKLAQVLKTKDEELSKLKSKFRVDIRERDSQLRKREKESKELRAKMKEYKKSDCASIQKEKYKKKITEKILRINREKENLIENIKQLEEKYNLAITNQTMEITELVQQTLGLKKENVILEKRLKQVGDKFSLISQEVKLVKEENSDLTEKVKGYHKNVGRLTVENEEMSRLMDTREKEVGQLESKILDFEKQIAEMSKEKEKDDQEHWTNVKEIMDQADKMRKAMNLQNEKHKKAVGKVKREKEEKRAESRKIREILQEKEEENLLMSEELDFLRKKAMMSGAANGGCQQCLVM